MPPPGTGTQEPGAPAAADWLALGTQVWLLVTDPGQLAEGRPATRSRPGRGQPGVQPVPGRLRAHAARRGHRAGHPGRAGPRRAQPGRGSHGRGERAARRGDRRCAARGAADGRGRGPDRGRRDVSPRLRPRLRAAAGLGPPGPADRPGGARLAPGRIRRAVETAEPAPGRAPGSRGHGQGLGRGPFGGAAGRDPGLRGARGAGRRHRGRRATARRWLADPGAGCHRTPGGPAGGTGRRGGHRRRRAGHLQHHDPALAARRRRAPSHPGPAHRAARPGALAHRVRGRGDLRGREHGQYRRDHPRPPGSGLALKPRLARPAWSTWRVLSGRSADGPPRPAEHRGSS